MPLPAFVGGLPGGIELAVLVLNFVVFSAIVYVLFAVIRAISGSSRSDLEARVTNLEGQVAALRDELRDREE